MKQKNDEFDWAKAIERYKRQKRKLPLRKFIVFFKKFIAFFNWNRIKIFLVVLFCLSIITLIILLICNFAEFSQNFAKDNPIGELIKVFLTLIAGIVAILVWHNGYKQIQIMYKGNVDTRFNNAVGHLNSENPTVVLGGIHALHQIAVNHKRYTQVVHSLFCSFLRENSSKLYDRIDIKIPTDKSPLIIPTKYKKPKKTLDKCPVIIQILVDYLFKPYNNKDSVYKDYYSNLSFSTLKNVNFENVKIDGVNFNHCFLKNCNFEGTLINCFFGSINRSNFHVSDWFKQNGVTLIECNFIGVLTNCNFYGDLSFCDFGGNSLNFNKAILTDCVFEGTISDCNYQGTLTNCTFGIPSFHTGTVTLASCDFGGTLTRCRFNGTLINCEFVQALYNPLTGGTLTKCSFSGTLRKCSFKRGDLEDCNFCNRTSLRNCDFREGKLTKCKFIDKKFDGKSTAKLIDCYIEPIELIDTELPPNEINGLQ